MATQATIKGWLETLAADMKSSPMSDSEWADRMATIIYDAITGRAVTTTGVQSGGSSAPGTVDP